MMGEQQTFKAVLALQGKEVELGAKRSGKKKTGKVVYTMFDSLLLESNGVREAIRYADISYLQPLQK